MSDDVFVPGNELERTLMQAQRGAASTPEFLNVFANSQVFVLLDRKINIGDPWDPSINLCVMTNAVGSPVVPVFTAAERATPWIERAPQFQHGLMVSSVWLLQGLAPGAGVVVNPGYPVGVELSPEAIKQIKEVIAAATTTAATTTH